MTLKSTETRFIQGHTEWFEKQNKSGSGEQARSAGFINVAVQIKLKNYGEPYNYLNTDTSGGHYDPKIES